MLLGLRGQLLSICLDPGIKEYGVGRPLLIESAVIAYLQKRFPGESVALFQDI